MKGQAMIFFFIECYLHNFTYFWVEKFHIYSHSHTSVNLDLYWIENQGIVKNCKIVELPVNFLRRSLNIIHNFGKLSP